MEHLVVADTDVIIDFFSGVEPLYAASLPRQAPLILLNGLMQFGQV